MQNQGFQRLNRPEIPHLRGESAKSGYLHWLFERLPRITNQEVHTLTPAAYAAEQAALAAAKAA